MKAKFPNIAISFEAQTAIPYLMPMGAGALHGSQCRCALASLSAVGEQSSLCWGQPMYLCHTTSGGVVGVPLMASCLYLMERSRTFSDSWLLYGYILGRGISS